LLFDFGGYFDRIAINGCFDDSASSLRSVLSFGGKGGFVMRFLASKAGLLCVRELQWSGLVVADYHGAT